MFSVATSPTPPVKDLKRISRLPKRSERRLHRAWINDAQASNALSLVGAAWEAGSGEKESMREVEGELSVVQCHPRERL